MSTKTVLVTGGSRGIGASTARVAARAGWDVCVNYQRDSDAAERVVDEVLALGQRAVAVQADVSSEADVTALFDRCAAQLEAPHAVVSNAGIIGRASTLVDASVETIRDALDTNLLGALLVAREAARRLGTGGSLVNVSSAAATLGSPNEFVWYAATKGGTDSLTIGLAKELGPKGIRVNAVSPGLIETDIHDSSGIEDRIGKLVGGVPLGRSGHPDEVAETIVWLMSDAASYVSGAIVRIGGGR